MGIGPPLVDCRPGPRTRSGRNSQNPSMFMLSPPETFRSKLPRIRNLAWGVRRSPMRARGAWLGLALAVVCPSLAVAHVDGMNLSVSLGTGPGEVTLDWTGGQP